MLYDVFRYALTVRYFETDQMSVAYYAHYLVWFEEARTEYLRHKGFPYKRLETLGFFLPVSEAYCKYMAPARYDDRLIVETWIEEMKSVSLKISYKIIREEDKILLATGFTVHPCINKERKIVRFPEAFMSTLK